MTRDEAVTAILNAACIGDATVIRNQIAMEAMERQRPEADADACRRAFFARWADEVIEQHKTPLSALPRLHWTGD